MEIFVDTYTPRSHTRSKYSLDLGIFYDEITLELKENDQINIFEITLVDETFDIFLQNELTLEMKQHLKEFIYHVYKHYEIMLVKKYYNLFTNNRELFVLDLNTSWIVVNQSIFSSIDRIKHELKEDTILKPREVSELCKLISILTGQLFYTFNGNNFYNRKLIELDINSHKGYWVKYCMDSNNINDILSELYHHANKLKEAYSINNKSNILEYCADISNICMFMHYNINKNK